MTFQTVFNFIYGPKLRSPIFVQKNRKIILLGSGVTVLFLGRALLYTNSRTVVYEFAHFILNFKNRARRAKKFIVDFGPFKNLM